MAKVVSVRGHSEAMPSALLLTRDHSLREEVIRLGSAAGVEVIAPADIGMSGAEWRRAAVVVVGVDVVHEAAGGQWPRRSGVLAVTWGPPADTIFRSCVAIGVESVLELPAAATLLAERLADAGEGRESRALVVGVIGGSGGAGATTFAVALAQVAASGRRTLLVDTDALGPGLDALFGTAERSGVRWSELHGSSGRLGGRAVREALPCVGPLPFLTWGGTGRSPSAELLREVVAAARRANDLVVMDLSRALDALVAEAFAACDLVLVIVRPSVDGVSSAGRLVAQIPDRARARAVVRGRESPLERDLGIPVVLRMGEQRGIAESIALGLGPMRNARGPLGRAAASVLGWMHGGSG